MEPTSLNKRPIFYKNIAGMADTNRLDGGTNIGFTSFPILKKVDFEINVPNTSYEPIYLTIQHNLGKEYDFVGKYISWMPGISATALAKAQKRWKMMPSLTGVDITGNPVGITVQYLDKNSLVLYMYFGISTAQKGSGEIYFIKRTFDD